MLMDFYDLKNGVVNRTDSIKSESQADSQDQKHESDKISEPGLSMNSPKKSFSDPFAQLSVEAETSENYKFPTEVAANNLQD